MNDSVKFEYSVDRRCSVHDSDNIFAMLFDLSLSVTGDLSVHIGDRTFHFEKIHLAHFARELEAVVSDAFFVVPENERSCLMIPDHSECIYLMMKGDNVTFSIGTRRSIHATCECHISAFIREVRSFYQNVLDEIVDANPHLLQNPYFLFAMRGATYIAHRRGRT